MIYDFLHIKNAKSFVLHCQRYEEADSLRDLERSMELNKFKTYNDFTKAVKRRIESFPELSEYLKPYLIQEIRSGYFFDRQRLW